MTERLSILLSLLLLACGGGDAPADEPIDEMTTGDEAAAGGLALPNQRMHDGVITGGAPTEADLEAAAARGVTLVISLRTDAEPGQAEEAAMVERLGMRYAHVPVAGADGLTLENVEAVSALLDDAQGEVVLHCASGNRAGAILAIRAWLAGQHIDAAMETGRAAGLTGLADAVRARLTELCEADAQRSC